MVYVVIYAEEMRALSVHRTRLRAEGARQRAIDLGGIEPAHLRVDEVILEDDTQGN